MDNKNQQSPSYNQGKDALDDNADLQDNASISKEKLIQGYKAFVLTKGSRPRTVYALSEFMAIEEKSYYIYFSSLNNLEQEIWKGYFDDTVLQLEKEAVYKEYAVREKLLAFFFTLIEAMKADRSFVITIIGETSLPRWRPSFLTQFQLSYFDYVNDLIEEGKESGEVAERFLISRQYKQGLWAELLFILNFWAKDESLAFERTDAAVEKSVNLMMDLIGRTALDSFADFAKFLYQSWK